MSLKSYQQQLCPHPSVTDRIGAMDSPGEKSHRRNDGTQEKLLPLTSVSAGSVHDSHRSSIFTKAIIVVFSCLVIYVTCDMLMSKLAVISIAAGRHLSTQAGEADSAAKHTVPQYFQTSPELWAGPTATGRAPFLAQTNAVSFGPSATYVPNQPLETAMPIVGNTQNQSIFQHMGYLSPYYPSPGFGVDEFPLPRGAKIVQVQMLSRHGSRYPTLDSNVQGLGAKVAKAKKAGHFKGTGALQFLNDWEYELGHEILVPRGRQELFESGILHYYNYAQLYNPNSKIIARTTTQDRMLKSAEYFLAGFFGLEWTNNATIEVIIEAEGFNNSLAGYKNCPNSYGPASRAGNGPSANWVNVYLQEATSRLAPLVEGLEWTVDDTFAAQNMCPYETVAYGYSVFCDLFTYDEWKGFSYSVDLAFAATSSFQSPTGRAIGLGYVQEVLARLNNHTLGYSGSQINTTLDSMEETFPLNQSIYFDFSHDTNIMSILTAFGLRQFSGLLNDTVYPGPHPLTISHMEPFGARLDIELIKTPQPLGADRKYSDGAATTYIHFILNQRTIPLGKSFEECGDRLDGWCELSTFLEVQKKAEELANFDFACFGKYDVAPYGEVWDGRPVT